jgi:hypothetical protein
MTHRTDKPFKPNKKLAGVMQAMDKPKTAEQINSPLVGICNACQVQYSCNTCQIKTGCERCKSQIEKDYARRIRAGIEGMNLRVRIGEITGAEKREICQPLNTTWKWQEFWKEFVGE